MKLKIGAIIVYGIAMALLVVGFILPPPAVIDGSVLIASAIIIGGFQLLFGENWKIINISKEGVSIEKQDNEKI